MARLAVFVVALVATIAALYFNTEFFSIKPNRLLFNPYFGKFHWENTTKFSPFSKETLEATEEFDYIVIGTGSAGSVVAHRLVNHEKTTLKVLVLEAGMEDNWLNVALPPAFGKLLGTEKDWKYMTEAGKIVTEKLHWPRGKLIGGSSSVNAMMYVRGSAEDFDAWEQKYGNKGWNYASLLPYFKKSEKFMASRLTSSQDNNIKSNINKYHGQDGKWIITENSISNLTKLAIESMSKGLNLPFNTDYNGEKLEGVSITQVNIHEGRRMSLADAFLDSKTLKKDNMYIQTHAPVKRIIFDQNKKAIGVEYLNTKTGKSYFVRAKKEIILSAGAINSPQILMLSGVGDASQLLKLNIPVVHDLKPVGKNLQDHPVTGSYVVINSTNEVNSLHSQETLSNLLKWMFFGKGRLASNGCEAMAFAKSSLASELQITTPDIQYIFINAILDKKGVVNARFVVNDTFTDGFSLVAVLLKPLSRGYLELNSTNPTDPPLIHANYFDHPADLNRLEEAYLNIKKVIQTSPLKDIFVKYAGEDHLKQYKTIKDEVLHTFTTLYHPVSTCKMGQDETAVVDERLRVRGIKGVRVVDASVMPEIINANTQAATVVIAEKGSDLILEDLYTTD